jgi:hypothetical protein
MHREYLSIRQKEMFLGRVRCGLVEAVRICVPGGNGRYPHVQAGFAAIRLASRNRASPPPQIFRPTPLPVVRPRR